MHLFLGHPKRSLPKNVSHTLACLLTFSLQTFGSITLLVFLVLQSRPFICPQAFDEPASSAKHGPNTVGITKRTDSSPCSTSQIYSLQVIFTQMTMNRRKKMENSAKGKDWKKQKLKRVRAFSEGSNDVTKGIEQYFFNFTSPKDLLENSLK